MRRRSSGPRLGHFLRPPALADLGPLAGRMEFAATAGARSPRPTPAELGLPGGLGSLRLQGRWPTVSAGAWAGSSPRARGGPGARRPSSCSSPAAGTRSRPARATAPAPPTPALRGSACRRRAAPSGAAFARDRWRLGDRLTATAGARYTYVGFLPDSHHADAVRADRAARRRPDPRARLGRDAHPRPGRRPADAVHGGGLAGHHLGAAGGRPAPGALACATRSASIARSAPPASGPGVFDETTERPPAHDLRRQHAARPQRRERRGPGLRSDARPSLRRRRERLGDLHLRPRPPPRGVTVLADVAVTSFDEAEFHDLVARLETVIDWSDTRAGGALPAERAVRRPGGRPSPARRGRRRRPASTSSSRRGYRSSQPLTRADWELLVAVRNMFYEASQAGFLDELAVQDPPTRVVGGISVRF